MISGENFSQQSMTDEEDFTGWSNHRIVPELSDRLILEHIQKIQRNNQIQPSQTLEGRYNLTIEMETGVGKTYTYIKTMYELNKHYGWSKFIVVVPSIAIREGVYKSFDIYADMFEEEYNDIISNLQIGIGEDDYMKYLESIPSENTHAGYFSIDKKGKMIDSKVARKETTSDDVDAYDLIMKNKELLLDRNPKKSPVRFIFSHSALREGWDNPNVFQICTLKQSSSETRKRQEVGRGLRLCVNQDGERMDTNVLGNDVHNVNVLTVIASESYDSFAKGLQSEIAEAVADRPRAVTAELFIGKIIKDNKGNEQVIDSDTGHAIYFDLIVNGYIDKKGVLTDKYYEDKANGEIKVADEVADSAASVIEIIDSIYDSRNMPPEDARKNNVELTVDENKLAMPEFKALWDKINSKSVYVVDFDTDELVKKAIASLDKKLRVSKIYFKVETGAMEQINSKEELTSGASFVKCHIFCKDFIPFDYSCPKTKKAPYVCNGCSKKSGCRLDKYYYRATRAHKEYKTVD